MVAASFYVVEDVQGADGGVIGRYRATEHTVGPWAPDLQHAGPPTALLVHAIEHLRGADTILPPRALPARVTAEIFRPVPVTDVVVRARLRRPGRRVAWVEADLSVASDPDAPVMRAFTWLVRRAEEPMPLPPTPTSPPPPSGTAQGAPGSWGGGYLDAVSWELAAGSFAEPGPATAWTRLRVDLVDTQPTTPVEHVAIVADAGSGISSVADPSRLVFVNTEITLHLVREPRGEQVWMDSRTVIDPLGVGHAHTVLGDAAGAVGTADQTLFVDPR